MGYTTDFEGSFKLDRPLDPAHAQYLLKFGMMRRNAVKAAALPDPIREAAGLPIGREGCYFVGAGGDFGQGDDDSITNYNYAPEGQPGLRCQWVPDTGEMRHWREGPDLTACDRIQWDGNEKFYCYVEWLEYIIAHFLKPWGYVLNGEVEFQGEDRSDMGLIDVTDNTVSVKCAVITYE
ncbi:MAG: hypothetical protein P1V36_00435 [Planctomycetota bacterium]|nr:hypothetical protein [Planctomycetota bacterium]